MMPLRKSPSLKIILLTAILTAVIFAPIIWRLASTGYDYQVHMDIAATMLKTGIINTPHFLLQGGALLLSPFAGGLFNGTVLLVLMAEVGTSVIISRSLLKGETPLWIAVSMTIALLLAAPVAVLFPLDRHLYLGYIGLNLYHNPTMFLLKPLALLSFIFTVKAIDSGTRLPPALFALSLVLTVACAVAKPSYTIVILPVIAITVSCLIILKRRFDWTFLLGSIVVPALIVLLIQYRMTYSSSQLQGVYSGNSGIIFAPLTVMKSYSEFLLPKLLLSLLFPLTVLAVSFRGAVKDTGLQLGWLASVVGCFYTYLLAESGPRMFQGNFSWSAQIAFFVLFFSSAKYVLDVNRSSPGAGGTARQFICSIALILHVVFGIAFYLAEFVQTEFYW